jgi:hypothetical protein
MNLRSDVRLAHKHSVLYFHFLSVCRKSPSAHKVCHHNRGICNLGRTDGIKRRIRASRGRRPHVPEVALVNPIPPRVGSAGSLGGRRSKVRSPRMVVSARRIVRARGVMGTDRYCSGISRQYCVINRVSVEQAAIHGWMGAWGR